MVFGLLLLARALVVCCDNDTGMRRMLIVMDVFIVVVGCGSSSQSNQFEINDILLKRNWGAPTIIVKACHVGSHFPSHIFNHI